MANNPYIVIEWNDTETSAKGWLCAFNFVNHYCGGGTGMHLAVTKEKVIRLATCMSYKYKASESTTTGGCEGGIAYDYKAPDAKDVLRRYIIAMMPYINAGVSLGGGHGVDYSDVLKIFDELGYGLPQTKAMKNDPKIRQGIKNHDEMVGMKYDGFCMYDMITGYGCAYSADEAWKFKGGKPGARVVIQGFGCVGASAAKCLDKLGYKIVGIADANLLVTCEDGLDIDKLLATRKSKGELNKASFGDNYKVLSNEKWLDIDCDILMPAAIDVVINKNNAHKVKASLIVEGASFPITPEGEEIIKAKGIDICVDFVANLGAVRFYDAIIFGLINKDPQAAVDDVEKLIRKNTHRMFEEAKNQGKPQREVALVMFAPDATGTPDVKVINRLIKEIEKKSNELLKKDKQCNVLREGIFAQDNFICKSPKMNDIKEMINRVAFTDLTISIQGESGVGKEVVARLLHNLSPRYSNSFVKINCGAIPENLLESELFGYESGAFTGANKHGKIGKIELAHHGTLFLDEIGEMPLALQVKLLDFLQDQEIIRVGGTRKIKIDTRVITATNRNLEQMVNESRFRKDLFYRLNVIPIKIPPLRDRREDIPAMAEQFLEKFNNRYQMNKKFAPEVIDAFMEYNWPGNVRELEHVVERAAVVNFSEVIFYEDVCDNFIAGNDARVICTNLMPLKEAKKALEVQLVKRAYEMYHSTYKAAKILQVDQSTVVRLLKKSKV